LLPVIVHLYITPVTIQILHILLFIHKLVISLRYLTKIIKRQRHTA